MSEKLNELLGTEETDEQVKRVERLLDFAQRPALAVTIMVDTRKESADIIHTDGLTIENLYEVIELARKELLRRERKAFQILESSEKVSD